MVPYFKQNVAAPLPAAFQVNGCLFLILYFSFFIQIFFQYVGWEAGRWVVAVGALLGLSTSLLGAMFPLPRVRLALSISN